MLDSRSVVLLAGAALLCFTGAGSAQQDSQELPDSSYLALTLNLPLDGTFHLQRFRQSGSSSVASVVLYETWGVDVRNCVMMWHSRTRLMDARNTYTRETATQLQLKEVDPQRISVRVAVDMGYRYDPQAYEISGYARQSGTRPVLEREFPTGLQRRDRRFAIRVSQEQAARRLAAALIDASERCDTWRTAPLAPIRSQE